MAAPASSSIADVHRVAVGSTNQVKVGAVAAVLARVAARATVESVAVPSSVPDQPFGEDTSDNGRHHRTPSPSSVFEAFIVISSKTSSSQDRALHPGEWA